MRPLPTTAMAVLVTAFTSVVAVAQTRPTTPPPRASRAVPPAGAARDSLPGQPRQRRIAPVGQPGGQDRLQSGGVLRLQRQLDLTDDQVKKIEALRGAARPQRNEADLLRARADLMEATKGDVNLDKARAAFDRMARVNTDQQIARLKAQQDIRNVLTPAQRAKMDAMRANFGDRGANRGMGGGRRGGMRGPAMRGQGMREQGMREQGMRGGMRGPGGMRQGMGGGFRGGMQGPAMGRRMGPGFGPGMGGQMAPRMNGFRGQMQPGQMGPGQGGPGQMAPRMNGMGRGMGPGMGRGLPPDGPQPQLRRRQIGPGGPPLDEQQVPPAGIRPPNGQTPPDTTK